MNLSSLNVIRKAWASLAWCRALLCACAVLTITPNSVVGALMIEFDYSYDSAGFFTPERKAVLNMAADSVNRWTDTLSLIAQSGGNTWQGVVIRPDTGGFEYLPGSTLTVPQDTILVYVGTRNLGPSGLAVSNKNFTFGVTGSNAWKELVKFRGETPGPPYVDYGPWGGSIAFNPTFDWHFGMGAGSLGPAQADFFTVAAHEMLHVLGFGLAESFNALASGGNFAGANAIAVGSPNNPTLQISGDGGHWLANTHSTVAGVEVLSLVTPFLALGQRLRMTDLDAAALVDLGWEAASPGDTDRDGHVNFNDAAQLASFYGAVSTATWSQGDFNNDGNVDFADAADLAAFYEGGPSATTPGSSVDGIFSIVYYADTGNCVIEAPLGQQFKVVNLTSASGQFNINVANWIPQPFQSNTPLAQGYSTIGAGLLTSNGYVIGQILDPGLTEAFLLGDLTIRYALNGVSGPQQIGNLIYRVPEPSSFALLAMGLVGLAVRRRRKAAQAV